MEKIEDMYRAEGFDDLEIATLNDGGLMLITDEGLAARTHLGILKFVASYLWDNRRKIAKTALVAGTALVGAVAYHKSRQKSIEPVSLEARNKMPTMYRELPQDAEKPFIE